MMARFDTFREALKYVESEETLDGPFEIWRHRLTGQFIAAPVNHSSLPTYFDGDKVREVSGYIHHRYRAALEGDADAE
jgi:hypothetical protein